MNYHQFISLPQSEPTFEMLGAISVDSGQVLITDPCYVYNPNPRTRDGNIAAYMERRYEECCDVTLSDNPGGETYHGVAAPTYRGDGFYPVVAVKDEHGNIERLVIEFKDAKAVFDEDLRALEEYIRRTELGPEGSA